ncbi:ribosomal protein L7/L12 [Streptomyces sp. 1222.5]|uniref:ribosomal protein L7/L12 n=1 Tax=Streptomyces sp. 1222.5 TaxID=1881026 RepID=UPI003EB88946
MRAIRTVTGRSLFQSKLLLDCAPAAVTEPVWLEAAQDAAKVLEGAGCTRRWCATGATAPSTRGTARSSQARARGRGGLPNPAGPVAHRRRTSEV